MTFIEFCDILSSWIGFMELEHYVILESLNLSRNDMVTKIIYLKIRKANITTWRQVYVFWTCVRCWFIISYLLIILPLRYKHACPDINPLNNFFWKFVNKFFLWLPGKSFWAQTLVRCKLYRLYPMRRPCMLKCVRHSLVRHMNDWTL